MDPAASRAEGSPLSSGGATAPQGDPPQEAEAEQKPLPHAPSKQPDPPSAVPPPRRASPSRDEAPSGERPEVKPGEQPAQPPGDHGHGSCPGADPKSGPSASASLACVPPLLVPVEQLNPREHARLVRLSALERPSSAQQQPPPTQPPPQQPGEDQADQEEEQEAGEEIPSDVPGEVPPRRPVAPRETVPLRPVTRFSAPQLPASGFDAHLTALLGAALLLAGGWVTVVVRRPERRGSSQP